MDTRNRQPRFINPFRVRNDGQPETLPFMRFVNPRDPALAIPMRNLDDFQTRFLEIFNLQYNWIRALNNARRVIRDKKDIGSSSSRSQILCNASDYLATWNLSQDNEYDVLKLAAVHFLGFIFINGVRADGKLDDFASGNSASTVYKNVPVIENRDRDPRLEEFHKKVFDPLWESLLDVGRPMTGRQALLKIFNYLIPASMCLQLRVNRWFNLREMVERGFRNHYEYGEVKIRSDLTYIAKNLRFYLNTTNDDYLATKEALEDITESPWKEWVETPFPGKRIYTDRNGPEYNYKPNIVVDSESDFAPYLYNDESEIIMFISGCIYCYARVCMSGIVIPGTVSIGGNVAHSYGAPNLLQRIKTSTSHDAFFRISSAGRKAALEIIKYQDNVQVTNLRIVRKTRDKIQSMKLETDDLRKMRDMYVRIFGAVLMDADRLKTNDDFFTWANAPQLDADLYEDVNGLNTKSIDALTKATRRLFIGYSQD